MKRFLRHAACLAAIFLLVVCPVKALAANTTLVDETGAVTWPDDAAAPTKGNSGNSIFEIQKVEKYWYVFLQVLDGDSNPNDEHYVPGSPQNVPLSGYDVKLTCEGVPDAQIESFYGRNIGTTSADIHKTDSNGKIGFRLPKPVSGTRLVTVTLLPHEGYTSFTPVSITLSEKETTPEPLWFLPIHLEVMFDKGDKGDLYNQDGTPFDYSMPIKVRWGELLGDKIPKVQTVADEWAHVGWLITAVSPYEDTPPGWQPKPGWDVGDVVSVKALEEHRFEYNLTLEAEYKRAYLVRYRAGDYGYLSGDKDHQYPNGDYWERVVGGEKPQLVPAPVPISDRDYWFVKWRFDRTFNDKKINPASVTINGDTNFLAVFDVRKRQPVIITTPTTEQNPTAPTPESSAEVPVIGGVGGGPGGGMGGGYGGGSEVPPSQETQLTEQSETLPQSPPEETEPENSETVPAAPASIQMSSWPRNGLILLCCLLTLVSGALRLVDIRRTIKCFSDSRDGEMRKEKVRRGGQKPLVTETIVGIICLILWGYFYANHSGPWDLMALILWGVILGGMAVLLLRGERSLRRTAEEVKD